VKHPVLACLVACAVAVALFFALDHHKKARASKLHAVNAAPGLIEVAALRTGGATSNVPAIPQVSPLPLGAVTGAAQSPSGQPDIPDAALPQPELSPSDLTPEGALDHLRLVFRQFSSMFGGNPVGTNEEITKALKGDNPKQINFLQSGGVRLNANGELLDPWGTPYFFHQLSGTQMEIRSAGPDKRLWTEDDVVLK
jgi:hypothetical protein